MPFANKVIYEDRLETTSRIILGGLVIFKIITHLFALFPRSIHLSHGAIPWLMAHDFVLYRSILEHRPPVTMFAVYSVNQLFGINTLTAVELLHLVVVLITMLTIYAAASKLSPYKAAAPLAAIYFALLESVFLNIAFYFEVVAGMLLIIAVWLLSREKISDKAIVGAGFLLGVAFFTKQQSALFLVFVAAWLFLLKRNWQPLIPFAIGAAIPTTIILGSYALSGHWHDYFYWNYTFNFSSASKSVGFPSTDFIRRTIITHGWLLPLALLALKNRDRRLWLVTGLGIVAQAMHLPRFGDIHAATGLPLVSVAFGVVTGPILRTFRWQRSEWKTDRLVAAGTIGILIVAILPNVLVSYVPTEAGFRAVLGKTEFADLVSTMDKLTQPDDTLYVLPSSDSTAQIHPLTGLTPPGTWLIMNEYFTSKDDIMDDLLAEWHETPPTWIIWFPDMTTEAFPTSGHPILDFVHDHYHVAEELSPLPFYGKAVILRVNE